MGVEDIAGGPEPLRDLNKLFTRTDARVAAIIEQGAAELLYFRSVKVPRLVDASNHLLYPARERFVPITSSVQADLISITRRELRTAPLATSGSPCGNETRSALRESLEHRPDRRAGPIV